VTLLRSLVLKLDSFRFNCYMPFPYIDGVCATSDCCSYHVVSADA
jgi:hypothetical protein